MTTVQIDADSNARPHVVLPDNRLNLDKGPKPLGQRLIQAGLIREDQLETALAHQKAESERLLALAKQPDLEGAAANAAAGVWIDATDSFREPVVVLAVVMLASSLWHLAIVRSGGLGERRPVAKHAGASEAYDR